MHPTTYTLVLRPKPPNYPCPHFEDQIRKPSSCTTRKVWLIDVVAWLKALAFLLDLIDAIFIISTYACLASPPCAMRPSSSSSMTWLAPSSLSSCPHVFFDSPCERCELPCLLERSEQTVPSVPSLQSPFTISWNIGAKITTCPKPLLGP